MPNDSTVLLDENNDTSTGSHSGVMNTPQLFSVIALVAAIASAIILIIVLSVLLSSAAVPCSKNAYELASHLQRVGDSYGRLKNMTTLVW
jgi:hypothetical protein